jgi:hypothetical protein
MYLDEDGLRRSFRILQQFNSTTKNVELEALDVDLEYIELPVGEEAVECHFFDVTGLTAGIRCHGGFQASTSIKEHHSVVVTHDARNSGRPLLNLIESHMPPEEVVGCSIRLERIYMTGCPYSPGQCQRVEASIRAHIGDNVTRAYFEHDSPPHIRLVYIR